MSVLKTITRRYLEQPQLITPSAFKDIASLLDMQHGREALQSYFKPLSKEEKTKAKMVDPFYAGYRFDTDGTELSSPEEYGVIKIEGPLTYKPEMNMCAPDTCNYQDIVKTVQAIADSGKKRIIMVHNSPGGEAYNSMGLASEVRKIADDNDIELIGYNDGLSASASYVWMSICDKIISNPDASTGSIGVVVSLINSNEALKKAGYKRTFITAGASKVPFDDEGEFKEDFLQELQDSVNELYENFVEHVATYRTDMSKDDVKNTEAKVFRAKEALKLGLIDDIMTNAEFKEKYLTGESVTASPSQSKTSQTKVTQMSKDTQTIDMDAFEAMKAELAQFKADAAARELSAKKDEIKESLSSATFLSNLDSVVEFMVGAEESQASLLTSIIGDATAALSAQKEEAAAELAEKVEEFSAEKKDLETKLEAAEKAKEAVKEEFAKPEAIRGEEKEENLQGDSNENLKARLEAKVAAKLAQQKA
ncbi:SohB [Vibrio phage vB_VpaM_R16F]|nr:SohB [Vibrio phage vB_VpaM_R16F]